jgi:hypothetical protein
VPVYQVESLVEKGWAQSAEVRARICALELRTQASNELYHVCVLCASVICLMFSVQVASPNGETRQAKR